LLPAYRSAHKVRGVTESCLFRLNTTARAAQPHLIIQCGTRQQPSFKSQHPGRVRERVRGDRWRVRPACRWFAEAKADLRYMRRGAFGRDFESRLPIQFRRNPWRACRRMARPRRARGRQNDVEVLDAAVCQSDRHACTVRLGLAVSDEPVD